MYNLTAVYGEEEFTATFNGNDQYNPTNKNITLTVRPDHDEIIEELNNTIQRQKQYNRKLTNIVKEQTNTTNTLNDTVNDLNNTVQEQADTIENLTNTIQEQNNTINSLTDTVTDLNNTIQDQAGTINTLNDTVNDLNNTVHEQATTINDLNNTVQQQNAVIEDLQEEIAELKAPKNTTITFDEITARYNEEVTISSSLVNEDSIGLFNQVVTLTIGETEVNVTTKGGVFEYTTTFKELGEKTVTASYAGNDKYQASDATTTFNVEKQDIIITYDPIADTAYGNNVTITGTFTQADGKAISNSNVNVYINGKQYKARTDKTGAFTLSVQTKAMGTNNVTLSYGGNDKYNSFETTTTFDVEKQDLPITYDPIEDTICGDNITITGKFTDINGKAISKSNVNVYINGKQYKGKTDSTGAFTLSVATTTVGTNNVTFTYGGNAYYNSYETSATFNVIAKAE